MKKKIITFKVSKLTKKWAFKYQENIIRSLSGNLLDGVEIKIKHR